MGKRIATSSEHKAQRCISRKREIPPVSWLLLSPQRPFAFAGAPGALARNDKRFSGPVRKARNDEEFRGCGMVGDYPSVTASPCHLPLHRGGF